VSPCGMIDPGTAVFVFTSAFFTTRGWLRGGRDWSGCCSRRLGARGRRSRAKSRRRTAQCRRGAARCRFLPTQGRQTAARGRRGASQGRQFASRCRQTTSGSLRRCALARFIHPPPRRDRSRRCRLGTRLQCRPFRTRRAEEELRKRPGRRQPHRGLGIGKCRHERHVRQRGLGADRRRL
jgi:hypothetical protein